MSKTSGAARYAAQRAEMAAETRTRILDACVTILSHGIAELSIPAVAREAGVSVPTVYRNFPDKRTLVQETTMHLRAMRKPRPLPTTLANFGAAIAYEYERSGSMSESVRAALFSEPILTARRDSGMREQRMKQTEEMLGEGIKHLSPSERERITKIVAVWCSSWTQRAFLDVVGASPEEAAEIVTWGVARLLGRESLSDAEPPSRRKPARR